MIEILNKIKVLQIVFILTYCVFLLYAKRDRTENKLLFWCLSCGVLNEIITLILTINNYIPNFNSTLYIIINGFLWLLILQTVSAQKKLISISKVIFLTFAIINLLFIEGYKTFNSLTFIFGSLLYVVIFIYDSYLELKKENLDYFTANSYILIVAPVLYFIGFSFIFGFKDQKLNHIIIFDKIILYSFISYFANFFYCISITYYIYKENKLKNG